MEPISVASSVVGFVLKSYAGGVRIYEVFSGSARKDRERTLKGLQPLVEDLCGRSSGAPSNLSLQKFEQFRDKIIEGNRLIDECDTSCTCFRSWRVEKCVKKLEKDINEFIRIEHPFIMALQQIEAQTHQSAQVETLTKLVVEGQTHHSAQLETLTKLVVENLFQVQGQKGESLLQNATQISQQGSQSTLPENEIHGQISESTQLENMGAEEETVLGRVEQVQHIQISQHDESHHPDSFSDLVVGFDYHIMQLNQLVLQHQRLIVIAAIGGAGKSTLAKAFCGDNEIRGNNISLSYLQFTLFHLHKSN